MLKTFCQTKFLSASAARNFIILSCPDAVTEVRIRWSSALVEDIKKGTLRKESAGLDKVCELASGVRRKKFSLAESFEHINYQSSRNLKKESFIFSNI